MNNPSSKTQPAALLGRPVHANAVLGHAVTGRLVLINTVFDASVCNVESSVTRNAVIA